MELLQLANAYESLGTIKSTNDLEFGLSWKISEIMESLETGYKRYIDERDSLVKKYGKQNKDGSYSIVPEKSEEFYKKIDKINKFEVDVELVATIEIRELVDAKLMVSKTVNLSALKPFLLRDKAIK